MVVRNVIQMQVARPALWSCSSLHEMQKTRVPTLCQPSSSESRDFSNSSGQSIRQRTAEIRPLQPCTPNAHSRFAPPRRSHIGPTLPPSPFPIPALICFIYIYINYDFRKQGKTGPKHSAISVYRNIFQESLYRLRK
ncbi:hypothetical protein BCV70DRAFT_102892 [Testicularia cyperi]|uniref:Uncharacterized protein n=1 Tax=Testicularia cyperi TaxID=1882483 RepID=A0A317XPX7_9BASI|nr:hypothetical protein BCV70DRAFT_102892 [Testicularia cyperi]